MCGIAGIFNRSTPVENAANLLGNMLARIQYRGPDESGIYINNRLAMGSVRLNIIDLQTGRQPMSCTEGRFWIVYNGEIFNYLEIRTELRRLGHAFRTESDTEVLLTAWMEWGPACLNRLNGQFVFAIWDNRNKELFIARDRVGIRPLFYTWTGQTLVFGSEIKSILEYPGIRAEIDPVTLGQVFSIWTAIPPGTIFKGISELPPGHYMKVSLLKEQIRTYWSLSFPEDGQSCYRGSFDEGREELEALLTDAVRIRLRADVPVAAYLSGGLDSSATTALIKEVDPESLQTFSIGFEDSEFDETPYQQEVSAYLKTRHTAFTCSREDIARYFPQVIWHTEIPVLRSAPVPMFYLSQKVRDNNIKVVITGEGADEVLAGYDIFKEGIIREFWSRQPESKYRPLLLNRLYPYLAQFQGRNKNMLKLFYGYRLNDTDSPFYSHLLRWHNTSSLYNYFSESMKSVLAGSDHLKKILPLLPEGFDRYSRLSKAQWLEIFFFMSGYLLSSQGDRMAMAHSVEGRYPFLDYRVIEFAGKLPSDFKMHGLTEKYILKKMMAGKLPRSVLERPKQAYRAPVAEAFLSQAGQSYVPELLGKNDIQKTGIFDYLTVERLVNKIRSGSMATETEKMALSGILSTQIMAHQYVFKDGFRPALRPLQDCRIHYEENPIHTR